MQDCCTYILTCMYVCAYLTSIDMMQSEIEPWTLRFPGPCSTTGPRDHETTEAVLNSHMEGSNWQDMINCIIEYNHSCLIAKRTLQKYVKCESSFKRYWSLLCPCVLWFPLWQYVLCTHKHHCCYFEVWVILQHFMYPMSQRVTSQVSTLVVRYTISIWLMNRIGEAASA